MKQKRIALLEEISDINNFINSEQKRLENQQGKNSSSEIIKSIKLSIINSQKDLLEKQESLKVNKFDEFKIILANKLADNSLNEPNYNHIIEDINNYANAFKAFTELKSTKCDLQIIQINEYGEDFKKRHETFFKLKEEDFNNQIKYFIKNFSLYQISPEKGKSITNKSVFEANDMEKLFNQLSDFIESEQLNNDNLTNIQTKVDVTNIKDSSSPYPPNNISKTPSDFYSIIKKSLTSSNIKSIICIDDTTTKVQLCELYNIKETDDIQILAIYHFNNKTLGDLLGMPKKIYEQLHATHYDTPIGEQVGLYCFNTDTCNLVQMQNKTPIVCISKGEKLNVNHSDSQTIEDELATVDFSGLNLSFYIDNNEKMCIARNIDNTLQEISTKTLEDIQKSINSKQIEENSETNASQAEVQQELDIQVDNIQGIENKTSPDSQSIYENEDTTLPVVIKKASLIKRFFNKLKSFFTYSAQTNGDV